MVSVGSRVKETLLPDLVLDAKGSHAGIGVTVEDGAVVGIGPARLESGWQAGR
jgi:hypothetical protein